MSYLCQTGPTKYIGVLLEALVCEPTKTNHRDMTSGLSGASSYHERKLSHAGDDAKPKCRWRFFLRFCSHCKFE